MSCDPCMSAGTERTPITTPSSFYPPTRVVPSTPSSPSSTIPRSLPAYPFLAVAVAEIIDSLRVPHFSDTEKMQGQESILSHDDEVDEEAGSRLDHADLTVRHRNKPGTQSIALYHRRPIVPIIGGYALTFKELHPKRHLQPWACKGTCSEASRSADAAFENVFRVPRKSEGSSLVNATKLANSLSGWWCEYGSWLIG